jgi:hypothetical protein
MQYLLQIFVSPPDDAWNAMSEDDQNAVMQEYYTLNEVPGIVGGARLAGVETATTVRVENGRTLTTDGPFIESREVLGGYYLFEADDLDAAIALAARIPAARFGGAIEVRPLAEM